SASGSPRSHRRLARTSGPGSRGSGHPGPFSRNFLKFGLGSTSQTAERSPCACLATSGSTGSAEETEPDQRRLFPLDLLSGDRVGRQKQLRDAMKLGESSVVKPLL